MIDAASNIFAIASQLKGLDGSIQALDEISATALLDRVAELHVVDSCSHYWWESLWDSRSFDYGDSVEAWSLHLGAFVGEMSGEDVYLAITDDERRPWPVMKVGKNRLTDLISELPFFEYFVFSGDCTHVVFDTHHNVLLISENPGQRAVNNQLSGSGSLTDLP